MARFSYDNFDLTIRRSGDAYVAEVTRSPAGSASAAFQLPLTAVEVENFQLRLTRPRGLRRIESAETTFVRSYGERLFRAVFTGDTYARLRSSLDLTVSEGKALRIRLNLTAVPELAVYPWEYLLDVGAAGGGRYLALSNRTPLVRVLDEAEARGPLRVELPVRILVMISSPSEMDALDVDQEWTKLTDALGPLVAEGLIAMERLADASLEGLRQQLQLGRYHVFHFIGHGTFDEQQQEGVLVMTERGKPRTVSSQKLGTLLRDADALRLAVLNSCAGGQAATTDPFSGSAQTLVAQGIPAVVAMQTAITDDAAISFTRAFYGAIANGYPVDAAVAEARKAIYNGANEVEWGTPILFMQSPDGYLFQLDETNVGDGHSAAAATPEPWTRTATPAVPTPPTATPTAAAAGLDDLVVTVKRKLGVIPTWEWHGAIRATTAEAYALVLRAVEDLGVERVVQEGARVSARVRVGALMTVSFGPQDVSVELGQTDRGVLTVKVTSKWVVSNLVDPFGVNKGNIRRIVGALRMSGKLVG